MNGTNAGRHVRSAGGPMIKRGSEKVDRTVALDTRRWPVSETSESVQTTFRGDRCDASVRLHLAEVPQPVQIVRSEVYSARLVQVPRRDGNADDEWNREPEV
jgi:hypothetical protein